MLGVKLSNIKIKKSNCGAKCDFCKQRNIFYSIFEGSFVYFCLNCKKWLGKYEAVNR